jgi:hypothetical protein
MRQVFRIDVLGRMIELRRPRFMRGGVDKAEGAEEIILVVDDVHYCGKADSARTSSFRPSLTHLGYGASLPQSSAFAAKTKPCAMRQATRALPRK